MIDKGLWRRLASLDPVVARERLDPFLTGAEIDDLLVRQQRLVRYIFGLIQERGEGAVLYTEGSGPAIETASARGVGSTVR